MGMLDDFMRMIGLGPKDARTREEVLDDLKKQAEEAESLQKLTEEAWGYKQRINKAKLERQKILNQAGGGKRGLSTGPKLLFAGLAIVFLILIIKSCG